MKYKIQMKLIFRNIKLKTGMKCYNLYEVHLPQIKTKLGGKFTFNQQLISCEENNCVAQKPC